MKVVVIILMCSIYSIANAFVIWPGVSAPCNSTLQACIDGSPAGEYIEIQTNDVIDEAIFSPDAVSLVAGIGYKPVFAQFRSILIVGSGSHSITVKGLTFNNGKIDIIAPSSSATINVLNNEITRNTDTTPAIDVRSSGSAQISVNINYNHVFHSFTGTPALPYGSIRVYKSSGGLGIDGDVLGNTVTSNGIHTRGIVVNNASGSSGTIELNVAGNEIRGGTQAGLLALNETASGTIDINIAHNSFNKDNDFYFPSGIHVDGQAGTIDANIVNNTMINSRYGIEIIEESGATVTAYVQNNILYLGQSGFSFDSDATITNDYNLYFDTGFNTNYTPGPNALFTEPMLWGENNARLRDESPAVDSGNTVALFALGTTPLLDADGTNRLKRNISATAIVDMGAYESGDRFFSHQHNNAGTYITTIDNEFTNNQSSADDIHVTSTLTPDGLSAPRNNDNEGIYYNANKWRIFNESTTTDLSNGATFNVSKFGSVSNSFIHNAPDGNSISTIDNVTLNGSVDKILMVTQYWDGVYNPHPQGIIYGFDHWSIVNLDVQAIPVNSKFNVYSQDPSKSAWEHITKASNISFDGSYLDNPLINDVPCAQIHVTQSGSQGVFNPRPVAVAFDGRSHVRKWGVVNQDATPMLENLAFHVIVNPAQIADCTDLIFKDDLE